jgi:hypothetical protein
MAESKLGTPEIDNFQISTGPGKHAALHGDCRTGYNEFLSVHAVRPHTALTCTSYAGPQARRWSRERIPKNFEGL